MVLLLLPPILPDVMNAMNELAERDPAVDGTDGREARSKFWIAAYTRPRSEKKSAAELSRLGIETYVPIQTVVRQWSDRKKKVDVIVIPMIIFAKVSQEEIEVLKKFNLGLKPLVLRGQNNPAKIPETQIDKLKFILKEADSPVTFVEYLFNLTDTVKVIRGQLLGLIGKVERITEGKTKLIICLDMLGGAMVEIDSNDLEIYHD